MSNIARPLLLDKVRSGGQEITCTDGRGCEEIPADLLRRYGVICNWQRGFPSGKCPSRSISRSKASHNLCFVPGLCSVYLAPGLTPNILNSTEDISSFLERFSAFHPAHPLSHARSMTGGEIQQSSLAGFMSFPKGTAPCSDLHWCRPPRSVVLPSCSMTCQLVVKKIAAVDTTKSCNVQPLEPHTACQCGSI